MTTDTKTALLDAAEQAARARGFDGFSYADLADAVGIRTASIHYHFATKAVLSTELMRRYRVKMMAACDGIAARRQTGGAQLCALVSLYRDALNEGRSLCLCVALTISRESLAGDVLEEISGFRSDMIDRLEAVFARGAADRTIQAVKDPGGEARAALALLEGAHLAARAAERVSIFDEAVRLLTARCTG